MPPVPRLNDSDLDQLSAYLDGELPASERADLEARLSADPALRAELETLRRTVQLVRAVARPRAPRSFALTPAMVRPPRVLGIPATTVWSLASAAAAVVLLVAGVALLGLRSGGRGPATAPQAQIALLASSTPMPTRAVTSTMAVLATQPPPATSTKLTEEQAGADFVGPALSAREAEAADQFAAPPPAAGGAEEGRGGAGPGIDDTFRGAAPEEVGLPDELAPSFPPRFQPTMAAPAEAYAADAAEAELFADTLPADEADSAGESAAGLSMPAPAAVAPREEPEAMNLAQVATPLLPPTDTPAPTVTETPTPSPAPTSTPTTMPSPTATPSPAPTPTPVPAASVLSDSPGILGVVFVVLGILAFGLFAMIQAARRRR